jgi:hypothetical protein
MYQNRVRDAEKLEALLGRKIFSDAWFAQARLDEAAECRYWQSKEADRAFAEADYYDAVATEEHSI